MRETLRRMFTVSVTYDDGLLTVYVGWAFVALIAYLIGVV